MPAMLARSACAVQMLLVALSRRMCCSRVWMDSRSAGFPRESFDTPTMRPGICRLNSLRVAKNAACGPPYPSGTPKRCALPTATSAPSSPGGFRRVSANKSVAITTIAPASCAAAMPAPGSFTAPSVAGYWSSTPNTVSLNARSSTRTSIPKGFARVRRTSRFCG